MTNVTRANRMRLRMTYTVETSLTCSRIASSGVRTSSSPSMTACACSHCSRRTRTSSTRLTGLPLGYDAAGPNSTDPPTGRSPSPARASTRFEPPSQWNACARTTAPEAAAPRRGLVRSDSFSGLCRTSEHPAPCLVDHGAASPGGRHHRSEIWPRRIFGARFRLAPSHTQKPPPKCREGLDLHRWHTAGAVVVRAASFCRQVRLMRCHLVRLLVTHRRYPHRPEVIGRVVKCIGKIRFG